MKKYLFLSFLMVVFLLSSCSSVPRQTEVFPTAQGVPPPLVTPVVQTPATAVSATAVVGESPTHASGTGALEGIIWELTSIGGEAPLGQGALTVKFENGSISGSAGCNSFGGEYTVRGERLSIGKPMSTLMACADDSMMDQEGKYLKLLSGAQTFSVTATTLFIQTEEGATLEFVRQD